MRKLRLAYLALGLAGGLAASVVAHLEGKRNTAYLDTGGVPTICYGETRNVSLGDVASDSKCDSLLIAEVGRITTLVRSTSRTPLRDHELAAFVSFTYNVGDSAFRNSTLARLLRNGDVHAACLQLNRWVYDNGRVVTGLVNRREFETRLCFGQISY